MKNFLIYTMLGPLVAILLGCGTQPNQAQSVPGSQSFPTQASGTPIVPTPTPLPSQTPTFVATAAPSATQTTLPTPTVTPAPLGQLLAFDPQKIVARAEGLRILETKPVTVTNLPSEYKLGQLKDGKLTVLVAEDATGAKVFVFNAYPASMETPNGKATLAGIYGKSLLAKYTKADTGTSYFFVPVLSSKFSFQRPCEPNSWYPTLEEPDWIDGTPALVIGPDKHWYIWWQDKKGEQYHVEAFCQVGYEYDTFDLYPEFGSLQASGQGNMGNWRVWNATNESLIRTYPADSVNSIVPVHTLPGTIENRQGRLGIIYEEDWQVYGELQAAAKAVTIAAIVSKAPYREGDQIFFNAALPTESGASELKVLLVPYPNWIIGTCNMGGMSHICENAEGLSQIEQKIVPKLTVGNAITLQAIVGWKSFVEYSSTEEQARSFATKVCATPNPVRVNCEEITYQFLLYRLQHVDENYRVVKRISQGVSLDGVVLMDVGEVRAD